ncbi:MAG: Arm DNA-binding domain-containing protein, partial [Gallionella sp.]
MNRPAALSDTRIRNTRPAVKPIKLTDGGGLFLLINPNGSRLWRYRYRLNGKENVFAIGEYRNSPNGETPEAKAARVAGGSYTLAEARGEQAKARALVKAGQHPSAARAETRRLTRGARETT